MLHVLGQLHRREDGMESVQAAMIVAVSALMLAVIMRLWPLIAAWFDSTVEEVVSWRAGP